MWNILNCLFYCLGVISWTQEQLIIPLTQLVCCFACSSSGGFITLQVFWLKVQQVKCFFSHVCWDFLIWVSKALEIDHVDTCYTKHQCELANQHIKQTVNTWLQFTNGNFVHGIHNTNTIIHSKFDVQS